MAEDFEDSEFASVPLCASVVCQDGGLITSRKPAHLKAFSNALLRALW